MIKLTLELGGEKREYVTRRIPARAGLEAFRLQKRWDAQGEPDEDAVEAMIEFIVSLFDGQFTRDEFLDGYMGSIFIAAPAIVSEVVLNVNQKLVEFPPPEAAAAIRR